MVAADLPELLRRLDGRAVQTAAGPRTLATAGARVGVPSTPECAGVRWRFSAIRTSHCC